MRIITVAKCLYFLEIHTRNSYVCVSNKAEVPRHASSKPQYQQIQYQQIQYFYDYDEMIQNHHNIPKRLSPTYIYIYTYIYIHVWVVILFVFLSFCLCFLIDCPCFVQCFWLVWSFSLFWGLAKGALVLALLVDVISYCSCLVVGGVFLLLWFVLW